MRQVISISFPAAELREVKKSAFERGFSSLSAYFKYLCSADSEDIISEKELLRNVRLSQKEYAAGKYIKAKSLADLL